MLLYLLTVSYYRKPLPNWLPLNHSQLYLPCPTSKQRFSITNMAVSYYLFFFFFFYDLPDIYYLVAVLDFTGAGMPKEPDDLLDNLKTIRRWPHPEPHQDAVCLVAYSVTTWQGATLRTNLNILWVGVLIGDKDKNWLAIFHQYQHCIVLQLISLFKNRSVPSTSSRRLV